MAVAATLVNQRHFSSKHFLPNSNALKRTTLSPTNRFLRPSYPRPVSQQHGLLPTLQSANNLKQIEEVGIDDSDKVRVLKQKMRHLGINPDDESCIPGLYSLLLCPKCQGGKSVERSLSLHVIQDADFAMWRCYRTSCGWAGQAFADSRPTINGMHRIFKVKPTTEFTTEGVALEPLSNKLLRFFGERMISDETLQRNAVMQMSGDQDVIAFTYRHNGVLVGCKYRTLGKRFWQEKGTEKWLYGIDDIKDATEEAGFRNCISVPTGAPQIVSAKDLPSLEKFSRIILATDGDTSGESLAEELARRLGKDRLQTEVLTSLGSVALKEAIETAELYQLQFPGGT
ncbi:hypothetical protein Tsubulata_023434 [Turnera subulata]|uniref:Toprim domain-containing protein n=1 Tax=Turnera subulata TaxID=218843 RepID=A0A9Q0J9S4_9ROSI|nr:hypothetical protein Tsubulata_023434 [Turnera subulata]